MSQDLTRAVDGVLIESLTPGLRQSLNDAMAKGATPTAVLVRVARTAGRTSLIYLACEAYLAQRQSDASQS